MSERHFSLLPFLSAAALPRIQIAGCLTRCSKLLRISYVLSGDLRDIVLSTFSDEPVRKNGLWKHTCFELFLAVESSPRYWEFNLSPAGHWNVYRFLAYREGMTEETAFASLPVKVRSDPDCLRLELEVDLGSIVRADQTLAIGISAVLKQISGEKTYWALTHCGPQADFHRRDSFSIRL